MNILFVDDEPSIRELFSLTFQEEHNLSIAEDGEEALAIAQEGNFDLIITDVSLPKLNGVDFIKRLRSMGKIIPFIIITGDSNIELAIDTFRMGAIDFFLKPFRMNTIRSVVERFESMHMNKEELLVSKDFLVDSESGKYIILPKIRRINYFVNLIITKLSDLPNFQEEDKLALKVTLYELISNAIEHGTAGINYFDKKEFLEKNEDYYSIVDEKCSSTNKKIFISTEYNQTSIKITIEDQGDGFDPKSVPDPIKNPSANLFSGRGLFLTKLNIDSIEFNAKGNAVTIQRNLKSIS